MSGTISAKGARQAVWSLALAAHSTECNEPRLSRLVAVKKDLTGVLFGRAVPTRRCR
jgi:hypothetical protein